MVSTTNWMYTFIGTRTLSSMRRRGYRYYGLFFCSKGRFVISLGGLVTMGILLSGDYIFDIPIALFFLW